MLFLTFLVSFGWCTELSASTLPPESEASADVIFSGFIQTEVSVYVRALAAAVNVSSRRVSFVRHGDRAGYAFGSNQIVRVNFLVRNFDDIQERPSTDARDALVGIVSDEAGVPKDLQKVGVVKAYKVPPDPRLYTFKVYSDFDLFYTFIYIVTAVLYASFVAFVIFRFVRQCVAEGEDKKNEEKEKRRVEAKREEAIASKSVLGARAPPSEPVESFDRSDIDKEMLTGVDMAAQRVLNRMRLLELEYEREQQARHLVTHISPEVEDFLNSTRLPPLEEVDTPLPRENGMARGGRPPLRPYSSAGNEGRYSTSINIEDL